METQNTIAELAGRLWKRGGRDSGSEPHGADAGRELSLEALEARIQHLEAALEGLQDAVYRESLLQGGKIDDLRKRTEPGQMARDLSEEARKRGV
jgi:hypothetical protein